MEPSTFGRRQFLASGFAAAGALLVSPAFLREVLAAPATAGLSPYGPLQAPNGIGLMLPQGFTARQIARGGKLVAGYPWHFAPDGGATYRTKAGGHVLVSNSETPSVLGGGTSAMRFRPDGSIESAYRILLGTNLNCAGGPTPWGTWLSCEEHEGGMVWEADPAGKLLAIPRPALGNFSHEATATDPVGKQVYLTEDQSDGLLYRFTPDSYPDLSSGRLDAAVVAANNSVTWRQVPDPNIVTQAKMTRHQVPGATTFDGGEGLWYHQGVVYFTTKGDKRVWAYDTTTGTIDVLYHHAEAPDAALNAVDNVTVSPYGDVYVCEDGGNLEICLITPDRTVSPFLRFGFPDGTVHPDHQGSEVTGVAFDPSGRRMYLSSQRAFPYVADTPVADGATYEVTGPFRIPEGGIPAGWNAFGPPAGERTGLPIGTAGALTLRIPGILRISIGPGLRIEIELGASSDVYAVLRTHDLRSAASGNATHPRPLPVTLARTKTALPAGRHDLDLRLNRSALGKQSIDAIVTVVAIDSKGRRRVGAQRITLHA